ncbi:hypothetical protein Anapl_05859 [Anas platyrhynchos]|uniref:Uncharacterized protein n=1 Tax=Anas platyrhynchos TaxID=8839 RepID=R0M397_ANAPL|nr:hypothetical protein Anapl_05859 [Anas platyrhynchos]
MKDTQGYSLWPSLMRSSTFKKRAKCNRNKHCLLESGEAGKTSGLFETLQSYTNKWSVLISPPWTQKSRLPGSKGLQKGRISVLPAAVIAETGGVPTVLGLPLVGKAGLGKSCRMLLTGVKFWLDMPK